MNLREWFSRVFAVMLLAVVIPIISLAFIFTKWAGEKEFNKGLDWLLPEAS